MELTRTTQVLGEKLRSVFDPGEASPAPSRIMALAEALDQAMESGSQPRRRTGDGASD